MRRTRTQRDGFSLIELLAVIAIIAILSGMTLGGISRVRLAAQRAQASADINALSTGIGHFTSKYGVTYIPAGFSLESNYTDGGSNAGDAAYLKRVFPNINLASTGLPDQALSQNQALVFFLTGGTVTNYTGFSSNRQQPFTSGGTRVGPFIDIPASKLNANGEFIDPWGTPYAYFTAVNGNDYAGSFTEPVNGTTVSPFSEGGRFIQQKSFQIISAGPNRKFGRGGDHRGANSADYENGAVGGDDLTQSGNAAH